MYKKCTSGKCKLSNCLKNFPNTKQVFDDFYFDRLRCVDMMLRHFFKIVSKLFFRQFQNIFEQFCVKRIRVSWVQTSLCSGILISQMSMICVTFKNRTLKQPEQETDFLAVFFLTEKLQKVTYTWACQCSCKSSI